MNEKITPLMQQYFSIKSAYPEALLFFQVGDFYELFFEDAKIASSFLAITLTKRGKNMGEDIPLCGVPVHALSHYLIKLIKGGFKIALCEQVSKPQPGTVVERKVTRVLTPGTLTDAAMLDDKAASYLCAFFPGKQGWGIVFTELLTAQVFATTVPVDSLRQLESEIIRFFPDEIVLAKNDVTSASFFKQLGYVVSFAGEEEVATSEWVTEQFGTGTAQKLEAAPELKATLELLYRYLVKNNEIASRSLKSIQFYTADEFLQLDLATQKHLELVKNNQDGGRKNSLLFVLDRAKTPMGSRLIRKWLLRPLMQKKAILHRQEFVSYLASSPEFLQKLEQELSELVDVERIIGRIALSKAVLQDYHGLSQTLLCITKLKQFLQSLTPCPYLSMIIERLYELSDIAELLVASLSDEPESDRLIKTGFDYELDRLRNLVEHAQQAVVALEFEEIQKTGISSLRIRYTDLFGYAFEVTKANEASVPSYFILQQQLSGKNRYITPALKTLEAEILHARQTIGATEAAVFDRIKAEVFKELSLLRQISYALATLDALFGFAKVAYENRYVVPVFNDERRWLIKQGRHPVVETTSKGRFIANDTQLSDEASVIILTGSNMGGKSTYLRQVALITMMAQVGSLVPAQSADLPIVDAVFTRIGSGDNVAEGKSTFLVEMEEVAQICAQSSSKSLVILDEVGRGTSTFDGMAIAHALIRYLYQKIGARTLFATHYHELATLAEEFTGVVNYHFACKKTASGILFLHTLVRGAALASFGIEVAKLAGLPGEVIKNAELVLTQFEGKQTMTKKLPIEGNSSFFTEEMTEKLKKQEELLASFESICLDSLSPKVAFDIIWQIKTQQKG